MLSSSPGKRANERCCLIFLTLLMREKDTWLCVMLIYLIYRNEGRHWRQYLLFFLLRSFSWCDNYLLKDTWTGNSSCVWWHLSTFLSFGRHGAGCLVCLLHLHLDHMDSRCFCYFCNQEATSSMPSFSETNTVRYRNTVIENCPLSPNSCLRPSADLDAYF